jgi:F-type H+-transporting ATPase subunit c
MKDLSWFTTLSTVSALLAIAIGAALPAYAMGRAISQALDSLARQPEAEKSILRALFIGLRNPLLEYMLK